MDYRNWPVVRLFYRKVPGPLLARFSRLWKMYHLLCGSYQKVIKKLHARYGSLVQIGPNEYSLSDKSSVYVPKLRSTHSIVLSAEIDWLERVFCMANLYAKEQAIDNCTSQLIELLQEQNRSGGSIDLAHAIERYAYEVMLFTTTHEAAGFLSCNRQEDISTSLRNWRFYAIVHGSYLRYHPFIAGILKRCGLNGDFVSRVLQTTALVELALQGRQNEDKDHCGANAQLEALVALGLAGADPAIKLMVSALSHIYSSPEVLEELRVELATARLSRQPTFKQLILQKMHMPKLHAVLLECARLQPPNMVGPEYYSNGEINRKQVIPPGSVITLEPTVAHVDSGRFGQDTNEFEPMRWLDASLAFELKRNLLAFNTTSLSNIESAQLLIATKMIVQMLSTLTLTRPKGRTSRLWHVAPFSLTGFYALQRFTNKASGGSRAVPSDHPESPSGDETGAVMIKGFTSGIAVDQDERAPQHSHVTSSILDADAPIYLPGNKSTDLVESLQNVTDNTARVDNEHQDNAAPEQAAAASKTSEETSHLLIRSPRAVAPIESSNDTSTEKAASRATTPVTIQAADTLESILGKDTADELLNGRFSPQRKNYLQTQPLFTTAIQDSHERFLVHKALESIYKLRLAHYTDPDTNVIAIGLQSTIPRDYGRPKNKSGRYSRNSHRRGDNNSRGRNNQTHGATRQSAAAQRQSPPGGFQANWHNFAKAEGARQDFYKTDAGYAERKAKMAEQANAAQHDGAKNEDRFNTTFKQTGVKDVQGKDVRKTVNIETY